MGAGAYALLREEEDRRKDLEALDGALGGWLSWAMNDPKPVTATVQMDCTPPLPVDTPEAPYRFDFALSLPLISRPPHSRIESFGGRVFSG